MKNTEKQTWMKQRGVETTAWRQWNPYQPDNNDTHPHQLDNNETKHTHTSLTMKHTNTSLTTMKHTHTRLTTMQEHHSSVPASASSQTSLCQQAQWIDQQWHECTHASTATSWCYCQWPPHLWCWACPVNSTEKCPVTNMLRIIICCKVNMLHMDVVHNVRTGCS